MYRYRRIVVFLIILSIVLLVSACVDEDTPAPSNEPQVTQIINPTSTIIPTTTRKPTITSTPIPTSLPTSTSTLTPTQSCYTNKNDSKVFILHDDVFSFARIDEEILDEVLSNNYPEWSSFRQKMDWYDEPVSAGTIIDDASFAERFALNPAVTLVTLGIQLNWDLPMDGDLFSPARSVGKKLDSHYWDYVFNEINDQIQTNEKYSDVANAATYAIYAFFEYDQVILEDWCEIYIKLYDQSPLYPP